MRPNQVRRLFPSTPILVLSIDQDESAADQAFRHGAQDYLLKGRFDGPTLQWLSGYTEEAGIRHGILDPGTASLENPFTPTSVVTKVRALLDEKGA